MMPCISLVVVGVCVCVSVCLSVCEQVFSRAVSAVGTEHGQAPWALCTARNWSGVGNRKAFSGG